MAPRVDSELLLVGSLPADSAESALRAAAAFYDGLVFALPDGETGPRSAWVGYERERLVRPNPDVVVVQETESPTGIPRHAYETPVFGIRPGVTGLRWDSWPRIDDAIAGYQVFRALRADGVIPAGLRFQVGLPFPSSALSGFKADFAADYPVAARAFEDLVARELARLTAAIPPERAGDPVGPGLRDAGPRGRARLDAGRCVGAVRRAGHPADPADPGGGPGRLPPVLRDVPRVADVRGAGHGAAGADGQLRGRAFGPNGGLAAPGRSALPAQRGPQLLPAAGRPGAGRRTGLPRHRAADRRGRGAAPQAGHCVTVPIRLRRGDVLRVRPPARRGRHRDHARARPRRPHRPRRHQAARSPTGDATDRRDSSFIGSRIITSPAGCRSILAISWSTAAPPSSASGMATLVTGTSRKARHSSSSKLTTDI